MVRIVAPGTRRRKRDSTGRPPRTCHNNFFPKRALHAKQGAAMALGLIGTKVGMTQVYDDTGKSRGFTGQMKRYNFQGLPAAHGAKKVHRSGGSIGSHASNRGFGRPKKGHKAAGQYGNARSTVRNLTIVKIDADNNLLLVRGAVPGPNGGVIYVEPTTKKDRKLGKQPEQDKKGTGKPERKK